MDIDTPMAKMCSRISHQNTYKAALIDLHLWGLIKILYWSKNQHRSHRIKINAEILPSAKIDLAIFDTIELSKMNAQTAKIADIAYSKLNKQRISNEQAMNKRCLSSDSYSKLNKLKKLKKLSQTDERNFLKILDSKEGEVTTLNNPKNQGKKNGAGGGDILKSDIIDYFLKMGWSAELAEEYYDTYNATNWTYNGEAIANWRAFAKGFINKQPSQQTYCGTEPPKDFF